MLEIEKGYLGLRWLVLFCARCVNAEALVWPSLSSQTLHRPSELNFPKNMRNHLWSFVVDMLVVKTMASRNIEFDL